ncbi:MAG: lysophospholipid acyltransferase family protein [Acidimicrobiia bacterium]
MAEWWESVWRATLRVAPPLLRAGFRLEGDIPVLPSGRLIVAANHFSFVDPVMVGVALGRPIRYLAVSELFEHHPAFTRLIESYGAVRLRNQGVPHRAIRLARDHLLAGGAVGIFPEGRRVEEWGEEAGKLGAGWLAIRTGAPMLPVFVHGSEWTLSLREPGFRFVPIGLRVGEPIDPADYEDTREGMRAIVDEWGRRMSALAEDRPQLDPPLLRFGRTRRIL